MDWFPLFNSLRIAIVSCTVTFFLGIWAAWGLSHLSGITKGVLDCIFTLPLVLPPTVVGFFLLKCIGPNGPVGSIVRILTDTKMVMTWYAGIFATVIVTFPLMYRTARGAFEGFDRNQIYAGRTLGLSEPYIFWRILLPGCKNGLFAGLVLSFARGLGEYGATSMVCGYTPGRTATISTTVYQLWREGNDALAYRWVLVNLTVSLAVLLAMNLMEKKQKGERRAEA